MKRQNIAIIGLNNIGTEFFKAMLSLKDQGVNVLGVSESVFTEGVSLAQELGINNFSIRQIIDLGDNVDIIFDLSDNHEIRKELQCTLFSSRNRHTVIAHESVARLMYTMIKESKTCANDSTNIAC